MYRKATYEDLDEIYDLMVKVNKELDDPKLFFLDEKEFVAKHIEDEGFILIARNSNNLLVGLVCFRHPMFQDDNLGLEINLPKEDLPKVWNVDFAVVHPDFRGLKLQKFIIQMGEELLDKSQFKYLMATVHPENPASFKTFESLGYKYIKTKEKYGGYIRKIYLKEL